MVQLVFEKFEELGSAYAVFRYLVVNNLQLGFRRHRGGRIGELEWKPASPSRVLSILRHPIYAGAYAYGLHRGDEESHDGSSRRRQVVRAARGVGRVPAGSAPSVH